MTIVNIVFETHNLDKYFSNFIHSFSLYLRGTDQFEKLNIRYPANTLKLVVPQVFIPLLDVGNPDDTVDESPLFFTYI